MIFEYKKAVVQNMKWRQIPAVKYIISQSQSQYNNFNYKYYRYRMLQHQEQQKQQIINDDDDSISVEVEPQMKQLTIHTDFDIKYSQDDKQLTMYVELDPRIIINLTKEQNKNRGFDDQRKFYKNCIFIRKIQTPQSKIKGNFRITYLHYKGMTFCIQLKYDEILINNKTSNDMFAKLKIHYKTPQKWETKWVSCQQMSADDKNSYNFEIGATQVQKILKQKLLLQIFFQKCPKNSPDYLGIQNEGNTCYANSTLQVLFHFIPLRKIIVELPAKKTNKLTKILQQIFVQLMTAKSPVRAEELLNCFDHIDNPHRQQDIHEYLIGFFNQLQKELPEVANFWTGKDYQITSSKQPKYESKQQQNFTQIQLLMSDPKGNHFSTISQSLMQLMQQDLADEPIDTEQFGKLKVYKSRYFLSMPPLLFMNIKRYQYNAKRKELKKINLNLNYPKMINLDFLMKTPQGLQYILYAVVVHKGRTPNSGHYFCFVNVSKDSNKSEWFQFNDSNVRQAEQRKVLHNYTGKKKCEIYLKQQYGKWVERDQPSQQTAYLLAYIKKDLFEQYQNIDVKIPSWQIQRLQQKLTQEQSRTMTSVRVFVFQPGQFRPFDQPHLQQLKLIKSQPIQSELKKYEKFLSCTIGTIWKINCKTNTIKHINKDYGQEYKVTVSRHTELKRGIRQPDYFMIVPQSEMKELDSSHKSLCILHIEETNQQQVVQTVQILPKVDILQKITALQKDFHIEYNYDQMQYFMLQWNGYIKICKS